MLTGTLRPVGGSVMVAIPKAILEALDFAPNTKVGFSIEGEDIRLSKQVTPKRKRKYSLEELVAQCDPHAPLSEEDNLWLSSPPVGREKI